MSIGLVTRTSRRELRLFYEGEVRSGKTATQAREVAVGDRVQFEDRAGIAFVTEVLPRRNSLARVYRETTRVLATNLDHVLIVAAPGPLFQPLFIDRVLAVCHHQQISCSLVINKCDLPRASTEPLLSIYRNLKIPMIECSAKQQEGLEPLRQLLARPEHQIVAITGISGVGKSTILNRLIPEADRTTAEVSAKTGLGRQTTSQAQGFLYNDGARRSPLLLIDLPGLQSFGVSHLSYFDVGASFPEFAALSRKCQFSDCAHRAEDKCAVKAALGAGGIAESRYRSYLKMLEEIDNAKPW